MDSEQQYRDLLDSEFSLKEISGSIIFAESASEIWLDPKDRFHQSNGPRIFQLKRELLNLTQGQFSVSTYYTKLKAIWEELNNFKPHCVCGKCTRNEVKNSESYHHMEYVMLFLMGLNDAYSHVRSQVLLFDPLPSINKVFSMITQDERQRSISSNGTSATTSNNMVFSVNNSATTKLG